MSEHDVKKDHLQKYYRSQQGKDYITYPGLLAEFHLQNDVWMRLHPDAEDRRGIIATLTQVPTPDNGMVAVAAATVTMASGAQYAEIGDADDNNVNRMVANARMRMAATRAKGRALRDATNIGTTMYEELPGTGADAETDTGQPEPQEEEPDPYRSDFPKASPYKPANANQLATIAKFSRLLGSPEEPREDMTSAEASDRITELAREYNERKGAPRRSDAQVPHGGMVTQDGDFGSPPPNTHTGGDWKPATEQQAKMIYAISMDLKMDRSKIPSKGVVEKEWSFEKASKWIDSLKAEQERRKADSGVTV